MRRNYISPEFEHKEVYGTYNMVEESNFFGAKMLEIEDSILVDNQNIIYYQMPNGEQLDLSVENTLQSYVYSAANDKQKNQILTIDPTQTEYTKENLTSWTIDLNIKGILANYLFAELKRWRTFEGIRTNMNYYNDVNAAINNYINFNVIDRYKLSRIDLYLSYKDLRSQNLLRYKNSWNPNIVNPSNKLTKFQSEMSVDGAYTKITFNQQQPSSSYTFEYFLNLYFEKL
jgi:hypothetical protein